MNFKSKLTISFVSRKIIIYKLLFFSVFTQSQSINKERNDFGQVYKEKSCFVKKPRIDKSNFDNIEQIRELDFNQFSGEKENRINELQSKFDVYKKNFELKVAKIEKQKQELNIQKNKIFTGFLGFLVFTIAIAFFMLILAYRNNKNTLLQLEKDRVSKSLAERELLLKEIHHRVKNNLQIVMSLLSIQAKEGNKSNIDDFLEKSQSRIASMSLIHQNLFENDRLDVIDYHNYLEQLVENLKNIIDTNSKEVTFILNIKEIYLDIQTAIPLGLIINELISNSFKHAFPHKSEGKITITINKINDNAYNLIYNDDGVGIQNSTKNTKSLGLDLVAQLTKQLKGTLLMKYSFGTEVIISFSEFEY